MANLTPLRAIRANCIDCSGGSYKEVAKCQIPDCPLYIYRFGIRPATKEKRDVAKREKVKSVVKRE